jgi:dTDP-4-amino-4,6-dideoxygalactose transaminase
MTDHIPLSKPTFGDREVEAVRDVLASGWVAGQGPRGGNLEQRFAELTERKHAIAVSNCTAALHLSLLALGVGQGDEVLVADYTYPATGHAVLFTGARPVFVDVRPDTGTIDPDALADSFTPRTRGVIAVDLFGQCADYEPLDFFCKKHGLFLLEDAAAAVGATYRGRPAGSLADVGCFSLHARKGVTSGEGGVIVTDDPEIADTARMLSCFGVVSAFQRQQSDDLAIPSFELLGYNYKLSDIQAAVALVQLERLPEMLKIRRTIADVYGERLSTVPGVEPPVEAEDREHTWQAYAVALDPQLSRGRVAGALRSDGIEANIGTFASHLQPVYGDTTRCPVSASLFRRQLTIPMHANLTESQAEHVASSLASVVGAQLRHA